MRARVLLLVALLIWTLVGASGCFLQEGAAPDIGKDDPGAEAWKGEIGCSTDTDCQAGEACTEGICQMKRCAEASAYRAAPPLGQSRYFLLSRDLVAASASSIDGYSPRDSTFARVRDGSFQMGGTVQDLAGGNLLGTRPEAVAASITGSTSVKVQQGTKTLTLNPGFVPVALAAGDTDGDGVDELIAAAASGAFAVCHAAKGTCDKRELGANGVVDVAMGDVDADGFAEVLFLLGDRILIYNLDADKTKQEKVTTQQLGAGTTLHRIAAGDLDGDEVAEIIGVQDGGAMFWNHDSIHVYSFKNAKLTKLASKDAERGVRDVSVVQTNSGEQKQIGRIAALHEANIVEILALNKDALATEYQSALGGGSAEATRLATADVDGDSPLGRLKGEPKVVAGPTAPIAVIGIPPYSQRYSSGPSRAMLGSTENKEESISSTVALSLRVSISAGFDLFGLVKAKVEGHIAAEQARTQGFSRSLTVGQAFIVPGDPQQNGHDAGGVVLGCGCFLQFDYEIDDPKHTVSNDAHGKTMSVLVPVGGQTTLWSTRRYNALAAALKTLPEVRLPYKLGDISSYPKTAVTLGGEPIPGEDMLFSSPPSFRVSDVATVMFQLGESTSQFNGVASTISYGGGGTLGAGVSVSVDVNKAATEAYELRVGRSTSFNGFIEPLQNDLKTPEDEFALHAYSFTPYVYREHYELNGEEAGLFVLMYAVGK